MAALTYRGIQVGVYRVRDASGNGLGTVAGAKKRWLPEPPDGGQLKAEPSRAAAGKSLEAYRTARSA